MQRQCLCQPFIHDDPEGAQYERMSKDHIDHSLSICVFHCASLYKRACIAVAIQLQ